jgi:hypothetical protein
MNVPVTYLFFSPSGHWDDGGRALLRLFTAPENMLNLRSNAAPYGNDSYATSATISGFDLLAAENNAPVPPQYMVLCG